MSGNDTEHYKQIENGMIQVPLQANLPEALDQIGKDGWIPWMVLGVDQESQAVRIGVYRAKRTITIVSEIPSTLIAG